MSLKVTVLENFTGEKGSIISSTDNVELIAHAVVIGKSKEGDESTYFVSVARPKNLTGLFESQAFHSDEEMNLTETQSKSIDVLTKAFSEKDKEGKVSQPRLRSILQSYYDDLKLAISANIRSKYGETTADPIKPFADAFSAVLSVSPKLAAKTFELQYAAINAIRIAQDDEPLPAAEVLKAKIDELAKKKAERKAKKA